jgi:O-antigen ligase
VRRAFPPLPLALYVATLASLPVARPAILSVGPTGAQISDVLLAATYVSSAVAWIRRRRLPARDALLWGTVPFLAVAAGSIVASPLAEPASWVKLVALAGYVLLPWLSQDVLDGDEAAVRLAVRAWLLGTLLAAAVALAGVVAFAFDRQVLTELGCSYGRLPQGPYPRVCLPFRNPNYLANYLTASAPLLLACGGVLLRPPWRLVAVGACAIAALFTLSTGIGGFALALGIILWATARGRRPRGPRAAALAAGALLAIGAAAATVGHLVPAGHGHVEVAGHEWHFARGPRVHTWLSAGETVAEHPVVGVGYGHVVARTPGGDLDPWLTGHLDPFSDEGPLFAEAHNTWLNVAGQTGLLGLGAFMLLVVVIARRQHFAPLPVPGPLQDLPAAVVAGLAGAFLFHGLFTGAEEFRHLWALAGLGAGAASLRPAEVSLGTRSAS